MNHLPQAIYHWYDQHQRDLPWRSTNDPYLIWVSEVILQQTRISQGLSYYYRFISRFPDVKSLASAPQDDLLKIWEGLGYYSRALNMHTAAKAIVNNNNGVFPSEYAAILNLKGIGEYTASAIASIAFGLPYAVTDGNVMRLLTRFFGISEPIDTVSGKKIISLKAREILDTDHPAIHNQTVMEFGALYCIPRNPDCANCPLKIYCFAFNNNLVGLLPVRSKKIQRKTRYFYFFVMENDHHILLEKRRGNDIWKNLYQFPLLESTKELTEEEILSDRVYRGVSNGGSVIRDISRVYKHELTHRRIYACFIRIYQNSLTWMNSDFIEINKKEIHKFAFPVVIKNYIAEKKIF
jgi:A/G-specific adenine glycosylase